MRNRRFFHTLTPAEGDNNYLVAGKIWRASALLPDWHSLTCETEGGAAYLRVEKKTYGESKFTWAYMKQISEKLRIEHHGDADSVEDACAAALSFVLQNLSLKYLGRTFEFYGVGSVNGNSGEWRAEIDGDLCWFTGPYTCASDSKPFYRWERKWQEGSKVLCLTRGFLEGEKPTLREAIIAAVDAPDLMMRACADLVATLQ